MILGGNGVLGTQFIRHVLLTNATVSVVCVGRGVEKPPAFSLYRGIDDTRFTYHQIHIARDPSLLLDLMEKIKPAVIVNFAAQSESSASWKSSWQYFETNNVALAKIVEPLAGVSWLKRWVQISSSEVYGANAQPPTENAPFGPVSPYSASKVAADLYLLSLAKTCQFPVIIVRPSGVYGPGQGMHRIVPKAVLCALTGEKFPLEGGGTTEKLLLHAEDLARALVLIINKGQQGGVYNVGPLEGITMRNLVEMVAARTQVPFGGLVELAPNRTGQEAKYLLDSSKLAKELGWSPQINLAEGIDSVIAWEREHLDFLKTQPKKYIPRP